MYIKTPATQDSERRHKGRIRNPGCGSSIGDVLDLSAGGLRIRRRGLRTYTPNELIDITISSGDERLRLIARIAWTRRTAFMKQEIGLEFAEMSEGERQSLTKIASAPKADPYYNYNAA